MLVLNQLDGFGVVADDDALTLTYVADSAIADNNTISIPAGAVAGDLAVLFQMSSSSAAVTLVTPSGWSRAVGLAGGASFAYVGGSIEYKVLTAGDISTGTVTGMAGSSRAKGMLLFRPSTPIASVAVVSTNTEFTANDPVVQTVTPTGKPALLCGLAKGNFTGVVTSGTLLTNGSEVNTAGTTSSRAAYQLQNDALASQTWDCNDVGSNVLMSCSIHVSP